MNKLRTDIEKYVGYSFYKCNFIDNIDDCVAIHNLLIHNIYTKNDNDIVNLYYGFYYQRNKKYDDMVNHCLLAINYNKHYSSDMIIDYYNSINDYDNMIKYRLLYSGNWHIIRDAYKFNEPKILLIFYNNHLQQLLQGYNSNFLHRIHAFLVDNIINSDLLLLIANIKITYFYGKYKLLTTIQNLLNNKIMLMNSQFKYTQV